MPRRPHHLITPVVALLCCAALHSDAAAAQGNDGTRAKTGNAEEMSRLNEEGFAEFRAGRYEAAADLFRQAYEAMPDPGLQKNEAVAWFKAGQCDRAMPVANAFLISPHPSAADRLEARSIVANCRVEMARAAIDAGNFTIAETLLADAESLQPDSYAVDQIAIARVQLAQAKTETAPVDPPNEQSPASPNTGRTVGWVLVGVGSSLAAAGATYWLVTHDRRSSPQWVGPVGLASGAAIAGVGVYLVLANRANQATPVAGVTYRW